MKIVECKFIAKAWMDCERKVGGKDWRRRSSSESNLTEVGGKTASIKSESISKRAARSLKVPINFPRQTMRDYWSERSTFSPPSGPIRSRFQRRFLLLSEQRVWFDTRPGGQSCNSFHAGLNTTRTAFFWLSWLSWNYRIFWQYLYIRGHLCRRNETWLPRG